MTSDGEGGSDAGKADAKPATGGETAGDSAAAPAKKPAEPAPRPAERPSASAPPAQGESGRGVLPVVIGGAVILAVFALIAFWPGDSTSTGSGADKKAASASERGEGGRAGGGGGGGVQAREYDEPSAPTRPGKRNPAVRLPNVGMSPEAPAPKDDTPPTFGSKAEEIAWYERKLEQAQEVLEARQKFAERLPKVREKIEQAPNAEQQLQAFEQRKKIVEDNFAKAQADVADLEKKLAELRGS
jgi:hypothetical protein